MDNVSKEKRSQIMAQVKGQDTKIELKVRSALFRMGLRFRKNVRSMPGSPDIVLPKHQAVVFIHGCFWHGHGLKDSVKNCKNTRLPKTRREYWIGKIEGNARRDAKNQRKLRQLGWRVFTIWECKLNKDFLKEMQKLLKKINADY